MTNSAYEGVRTGDIPSVRVGRRILIPRQPLLDVINRKVGGNRRIQHTEPSDSHHEERKSE